MNTLTIERESVLSRGPQPFSEILQELLREQEVSQRELSRRTRRRPPGLAVPSVNLLVRGELVPTRSAMEQVAKALAVPPETFAEYRLEVVRDRLNWRKVGLRSALRELARQAQRKSDGFPHITTLNATILREIEPSKNMMEAVARGFGIDPVFFSEYRLLIAREKLDPNVVGLRKALRSLGE